MNRGRKKRKRQQRSANKDRTLASALQNEKASLERNRRYANIWRGSIMIDGTLFSGERKLQGKP